MLGAMSPWGGATVERGGKMDLALLVLLDPQLERMPERAVLEVLGAQQSRKRWETKVARIPGTFASS